MAYQSFTLDQRVVIITGGGRGIGKVYARACVAAGMRVVIADIHAEEAEVVAQELRESGGEAIAVATDISKEESTLALAEAVLKAYGRIDGLVNNASLMSSLPRRSWMEIPLEEWDRVMAVDLCGLFLTCRAVYPAMKAQGGGKIVNVSSSRVLEGTPNRLHYTSAKAGVIGFSRALAREVGDDAINVNVVMPGLTLSETQLATSSNSYLTDSYNQQRAIKRPQVPEDLVGAVLFLLSSASDFITGQTINVDGGKSMH
ncbi:SDR family NAD(P)-dependent oxidoreductase [Pseudomonas sp. SST3]|jgi:3-oxoacyl-[acyl-carrier protein] reductase|uniref:SDR family NAD(P)-dependent oxidoreductase n=1 Tax=Pseudomonas sp. SST3 TaxID=2267882 RepID=UPI000E034053|nr:SDR family oxidoreductase [Pseudomonas sp. SST3]NKQ12724.1 SDR family oxidoreductase [Pseudomonas sp. SST3]